MYDINMIYPPGVFVCKKRVDSTFFESIMRLRVKLSLSLIFFFLLHGVCVCFVESLLQHSGGSITYGSVSACVPRLHDQQGFFFFLASKRFRLHSQVVGAHCSNKKMSTHNIYYALYAQVGTIF